MGRGGRYKRKTGEWNKRKGKIRESINTRVLQMRKRKVEELGDEKGITQESKQEKELHGKLRKGTKR